MEELINAMSNGDLSGLKDKYSDNPSVVTLIDGILATREREATQTRAMANFAKSIAKTFTKLPHPDNIHNVFARWAEVDIPDGEPEEVEVNGETVMRTPSHKEFTWVVEVNHATRQTSTASDAPKTSKRAITVYKRNGTQLELQGHFASASKACEGLKLLVGGDSATRVLTRDGYITEPYDGTDYTS